jgi:hypothetical protein
VFAGFVSRYKTCGPWAGVNAKERDAHRQFVVTRVHTGFEKRNPLLDSISKCGGGGGGGVVF